MWDAVEDPRGPAAPWDLVPGQAHGMGIGKCKQAKGSMAEYEANITLLETLVPIRVRQFSKQTNNKS